MRRALVLSVAAALAACNTGFEPQYRVRDLRILALSSHAQGSASADVGPTDTLALAALVVNPRSRAGLTVDWVACVPQASDALPPCLDQAWLADPARLLAAAGTVPGVVSAGTGASVSLPVPDVTAALEFAIYSAQVEPTFACRLYAELVVVAIARAEGVSSIAYKRIPVLPTPALVSAAGVTSRYVVNLNPAIGEVRRGPADAEACTGGVGIATPPFPAGGDTVICGLGTTDAAQLYTLCAPDGSFPSTRENLDWQWYVSDGEFPDATGGVGDARGSNVKFRRPAGPFTLWTLLRDGRGGIDWAAFSFPAAP